MTPNSEKLADVLADLGDVTIAVSGGVDSMTLACFAHRRSGGTGVRMVHAQSPAVPADAGQRIDEMAAREGWNFECVDAGEFVDARYRANPVNRCFFCKSNLYRTLSQMSDGAVLSGTNCDDLGDYRPGLEAARNHNVRHPYVEAGIDKREVRALAKALGLPELAELPSSPCLSSRVETGLAIKAEQLVLIDTVETWCRRHLLPETVRCRIRHTGVVIELDGPTRAGLDNEQRASAVRRLREEVSGLSELPVTLADYQRGSAFVGDRKS